MTPAVEHLQRQFAARFGGVPRLFSAPGRVNLIGEHTDYNDGFVLPMAIARRTYVAASPRSERRILVRSLNSEEEFEFELELEGAAPERQHGLAGYVLGTARVLLARGWPVGGANLMVWTDVPLGAGLSSSAALELAVAYALVRLSGAADPDRVQLALAGQAAEHEYVGTQCGIMDQYVAALGRAGCALFIDCRSLEAKPVPLRLGGDCILICDTRVKHELASSAYNQRRAECLQGVELIQRVYPEVRSLRDVTTEQLVKVTLPPILTRRCRHVVSENERTGRAVHALEADQLTEFGRLMSQSHASLQSDYEVSCAELDEAVRVANSQPGVRGSRMTGGGFGGCTVSLVDQEAVAGVTRAIQQRFEERFGSAPAFFTSEACEGVREESGAPSPAG